MQKTQSFSSGRHLFTGKKVISPAGRYLIVDDVFVPKNNVVKSRELPSRFRNLSRKLVVFMDGSMAPLAEIQSVYRIPA